MYPTKLGKEFKDTFKWLLKKELGNSKIDLNNPKFEFIYHFKDGRANDVDNFHKPIIDMIKVYMSVDDDKVSSVNQIKFSKEYKDHEIFIKISESEIESYDDFKLRWMEEFNG